ncbi:MAG: universal stress protein [Bacteroidetes bacterium]|nr:universal stress protein [Bacteroidota bacterium]
MKLLISKILVPIDFSEESMNALTYASYIAKKLKAEITILHVLESYEHNTAIGKKTLNDIIKRGVKTKLDDIVKNDNNLTGVKTKVMHKTGKIYKEIDDVAVHGIFGLIVMGTHGASGIKNLKRVMLGTNAYRVIHSSPCPVITIRKGKKYPKFENIVLPVDITKETRYKIRFAIEWARIFGSTINVVSVSRFIEEFFVDLGKLRFQLKDVENKIKAADIPCTTKMIRHNDIADSILKYSKKLNADLTIIMTRQERKWDDFIVGSSAKHVIDNSQTPVLSVRPWRKRKKK